MGLDAWVAHGSHVLQAEADWCLKVCTVLVLATRRQWQHVRGLLICSGRLVLSMIGPVEGPASEVKASTQEQSQRRKHATVNTKTVVWMCPDTGDILTGEVALTVLQQV